jgi:hypothetical protein
MEVGAKYQKPDGSWTDAIELQILEQPIPSVFIEGKWDCGMHANHETHAEAQACIERDRCPNCRDWHKGMGTCEEWLEFCKRAEKIRLTS